MHVILNNWPLTFICAAMVVAAFIDGWKLMVPNWLTLPLVVSGWLLGLGHNFGLLPEATRAGGLGASLAGTLLGFILLYPVYAIGGMGENLLLEPPGPGWPGFPRRRLRTRGYRRVQGHVAKRVGRVRAEGRDGRDAHHDDQGEHDGVFHGRRAALVSQQLRYLAHDKTHLPSPFGFRGPYHGTGPTSSDL